mmetsp:Transcript_15363/g.31305  ORF Transcript_15363/g.31305 Transcript_15363/m.31305 type:complete len:555 (+) Transcript_15363:145-1809(+)
MILAPNSLELFVEVVEHSLVLRVDLFDLCCVVGVSVRGRHVRPHFTPVPSKVALLPYIAARPSPAPVRHALGRDHFRVAETWAALGAAHPVLAGMIRAGTAVVVFLHVKLLAVPALDRPRLVPLKNCLFDLGYLETPVLRDSILPPLQLVPSLGVKPLQVQLLLDHRELELESFLVALVPEPVPDPTLENQRQGPLPALLEDFLAETAPVQPQELCPCVGLPQVRHHLNLVIRVALIGQQQLLHPHHPPLPSYDLGLVGDDDGEGSEVESVQLSVQLICLPPLVELRDCIRVHEHGLLYHELVVFVALPLYIGTPRPPLLSLYVRLDALVTMLPLLPCHGLHPELFLTLTLPVKLELVTVGLVGEELLLDLFGLFLLFHPLHLPARVLHLGLKKSPLPLFGGPPLGSFPPLLGPALGLVPAPLEPILFAPQPVLGDFLVRRQERLPLLLLFMPCLALVFSLLAVVALLATDVRVDLAHVVIIVKVHILSIIHQQVHLGPQRFELLLLLFFGPDGESDLVLVPHLLDLLLNAVSLRRRLLQLCPPLLLGGRTGVF